MLSFQRDQGSEPDAAGAAPGDGDDRSQGQEYLTVASHGNRTRKSTIMLSALFIIGMLCLWFMIKKSAPQTASGAESDAEGTQVEAAIARLTGAKSEMFGSMDEIVNKFYEFSDVPQVEVGELVKDPFKLEKKFKKAAPEPVVEVVKDTGPVIDPDVQWRQQVKRKAQMLDLQGIMQSMDAADSADRRYFCMIDGNILYEGDSTRDYKVLQIGEDFVKLEWKDNRKPKQPGVQPSAGVEIVLRMSE
ncbi:MAG: hypothetical protein CEE38_16115 [Planctomycetes bacterium B3_Pla]|nr:MAG: hypothetical protein CEE38_16115 [Planctomycetes bacterium B3_Pla]